MTTHSDLRGQVKAALLGTLNAREREVRIACANAIGAIGSIELPMDDWKELPVRLIAAIQGADSSEELKEAAIEALGVVCENTPPELLRVHADQVLESIAGAMSETASESLRLGATKCLTNALAFCKPNFESDVERGMIMDLIAGVMGPGGSRKVKVQGWQCLSEIFDLYYDLMDSYVDPIYNLTVSEINEHEDILKQAIEFWASIATKEHSIDGYLEDLKEQNLPNDQNVFNRGFIRRVALERQGGDDEKGLVDFLLHVMLKQNEDPDDDEDAGSQAAAICLNKVSLVLQDAIAGQVMEFVTAGASEEQRDWRMREAACTAFAYIVEGLTAKALQELVQDAVPTFCQLFKDEQPQVEDSAVWAIAQICQFAFGMVNTDHYEPLVDALLGAMKSSRPNAVRFAITSFYGIAKSFKKNLPTNSMSPYFERVVEAILEIVGAPEVPMNVIQHAYEAINALIETAAEDTEATALSLLNVVASSLQDSLGKPIDFSVEADDESDREATERSYLQSLLCSTIHHIFMRCTSDQSRTEILKSAHAYVELLTNTANQTRDEYAIQEAVMAVNAMCCLFRDAENIDHKNIFGGIVPVVVRCLGTNQDRLIAVAITFISQGIYTLVDVFGDHADDIMIRLVDLMREETVDRYIKPTVLACIGDIAIVIEGNFTSYIEAVMETVFQLAGSTLTMNTTDDDADTIEFLISMQEQVLTLFSSVLTGLAAGGAEKAFSPYVGRAVDYVAALKDDNELGPTIMGASCDFIGDLCSRSANIDGDLPVYLINHQAIAEMVTKAYKLSPTRHKTAYKAAKRASEWLEGLRRKYRK